MPFSTDALIMLALAFGAVAPLLLVHFLQEREAKSEPPTMAE